MYTNDTFEKINVERKQNIRYHKFLNRYSGTFQEDYFKRCSLDANPKFDIKMTEDRQDFLINV
jgi:hypothetical protein